MLFRTKPKPRSLLASLLSLIGWCGSFGAIGVSAMGLSTFFAPDYWLADNMSFFLRQFLAAGLAGCLGGALGFLIHHRLPLIYRLVWGIAVIAFLALAGLTGARTLANTKPLGPLSAGDNPVKIVSINLIWILKQSRKIQSPYDTMCFIDFV